MKSLQTIQKIFHVFEILTKIAMILSFVWAGLAALGLLEAHERAQERALAAAGTAHDEEDVIGGHIEIDVTHEHEGAVAQGQVADAQAGSAHVRCPVRCR